MVLIRNRSILEQEPELSLIKGLQVPQRCSVGQRHFMLIVEATGGQPVGIPLILMSVARLPPSRMIVHQNGKLLF